MNAKKRCNIHESLLDLGHYIENVGLHHLVDFSIVRTLKTRQHLKINAFVLEWHLYTSSTIYLYPTGSARSMGHMTK